MDTLPFGNHFVGTRWQKALETTSIEYMPRGCTRSLAMAEACSSTRVGVKR